MRFLISMLSILILLSCQSKEEESNSLEAEVIYFSPYTCCANAEILNGETIFGDLVGYEESILAMVNVDDFLTSDIISGDQLKIKFTFTEEAFPCVIVCDRQHGIPIRLSSLEKLP